MKEMLYHVSWQKELMEKIMHIYVINFIKTLKNFVLNINNI